MSAAREIRAEALIGRRVVDRDGRPLGRIEEIVAEPRAGELVVREYLTGERGMLARFSLVTNRSALALGHVLAARLFGTRGSAGYRIGWNELDLADPDHPRALARRDDLHTRQE